MKVTRRQLRNIIRRTLLTENGGPIMTGSGRGDHIVVRSPPDLVKAAEDMDIGPFLEKAQNILKVRISREWRGLPAVEASDPFLEMIRQAWNSFTNSKVLPAQNPEIQTKTDWAQAVIGILITHAEIKYLIRLGFSEVTAARLASVSALALGRATLPGWMAALGPALRVPYTAVVVWEIILAFLIGYGVGMAVDAGIQANWRGRYWIALKKVLDQYPTGTTNKLLQQSEHEFLDSQVFLKMLRGPLYKRMIELLETGDIAVFISDKSRSAYTGGRPLIKLILKKHIKDFFDILAGPASGTGGNGLVQPLVDNIITGESSPLEPAEDEGDNIEFIDYPESVETQEDELESSDY